MCPFRWDRHASMFAAPSLHITVFRLVCACLFLLAAKVPAAEIGISPGETFTYRVGWGIFGKAGDITVSSSEIQESGESVVRIRTETSTRGFIRALYPFDGQADTYYNSLTGKFIRATAQTKSRGKETNALIEFEYQTATANYTDFIREERSVSLSIPENNPADFITTLIQSRSWDLKLGESRAVSVLFDDEFYELVITAQEEETIKTKWGAQRTLVLVPQMIGEPKGMFKRGGEVRVWVAQDERKLPVRFEVKMKVGTGMAVLTDYQNSNPNQPELTQTSPTS